MLIKLNIQSCYPMFLRPKKLNIQTYCNAHKIKHSIILSTIVIMETQVKTTEPHATIAKPQEIIPESQATRITEFNYIEVVPKDVLDTTEDHISAHVYIVVIFNKETYVLFGHNKKYDNGAIPGGFSNKDQPETIYKTALREVIVEETLNCLPIPDFRALLESGVCAKRQTPNGTKYHYTFLCHLRGVELNMEAINKEFKEKLKNPDLPADYKEHDYLTLVPLSQIKEFVKGAREVNDYLGVGLKLRPVLEPFNNYALKNNLYE